MNVLFFPGLENSAHHARGKTRTLVGQTVGPVVYRSDKQVAERLDYFQRRFRRTGVEGGSATASPALLIVCI